MPHSFLGRAFRETVKTSAVHDSRKKPQENTNELDHELNEIQSPPESATGSCCFRLRGVAQKLRVFAMCSISCFQRLIGGCVGIIWLLHLLSLRQISIQSRDGSFVAKPVHGVEAVTVLLMSDHNGTDTDASYDLQNHCDQPCSTTEHGRCPASVKGVNL